MVSTSCCCECLNSEAEAEVGEEKCGCDSELRSSNLDFVQERILEDARRRSLLDYIDRLRCEPLQSFETEVCSSSVGKTPASKIRHSKKATRRSSALVKSRRTPKTGDEHSDSTMNVTPNCRGSILRGKTLATKTQASRSQSRNSFLTFSRTKGSHTLRRNCKKKCPHTDRVSSDTCDPPPTRPPTSGHECSCFSNIGLEKTLRNTFSRSNDPLIITASTSEEEIIDYQVPIESYLSSHRLCDSRSGSRTLVPTSSHVTIRICSRNSSTSLIRDQSSAEECCSAGSSGSENSLNHLEERVRRGLRAMCSREVFEDRNFENTDGCFQPNCSCCCKCGENFDPEVDIEENSDENSFRRFKDVMTETRRRRGPGKTPQLRSGPEKSVFGSDRTLCRARDQMTERNEPRRVVKHTSRNSEARDPPIILTARRYKRFRDRCEGIKKSMRKCEPATKESTVWKGDELNLSDFCPDLPPLDHWSQYEEGLRKVADEYKTLRSCLNSVETGREPEEPSCTCTEKSVTRTYPSGTEFTFKVKRIPDKKASETFSSAVGESGVLSGSKKRGSRQRGEKFRDKTRLVSFEKGKTEEERSCECLGDVKGPGNDGAENIEASCAAVKEREVDLVRTLEIFCEKLKSMKSEFEKPPFYTRPTNSGPCRACGRGSVERDRNKTKAKKLLIFPPEGENGPPLTLRKNSSNVNCRVKGNPENGYRYDVTYVQRFVSSMWNPDKGKHPCCVDCG